MSIVKSFSVGLGDMFYIKHNSDNFSIIDCCLDDNNKKTIVQELLAESVDRGIIRFISTHPDEDHLVGLDYLVKNHSLPNFYCIKNSATKKIITPAFKTYCELRDSEKAFHLERGSTRRWMNLDDDQRGNSGLHVMWPIVTNRHYKEALKVAEEGGSPNNTSIILQYRVTDGILVQWMGDLENDFMEKIVDEVSFSKVTFYLQPIMAVRAEEYPKNG